MTSDFDYKKYSLENLENWMHDAMSCDDASADEIYNCIVNVVRDNYYHHKKYVSQAYELLEKLNGVKTLDINLKDILKCDKDDPSPECQGAWNDFWEEPQQYTEEELNAMCDEAEKNQKKLLTHQEAIDAGWVMSADGFWLPPQDKKKWVLPVDKIGEVYFVTFPEDLLETAKLKEGDEVNWIDNGDGSYTLRKVTEPLTMDEC